MIFVEIIVEKDLLPSPNLALFLGIFAILEVFFDRVIGKPYQSYFL